MDKTCNITTGKLDANQAVRNGDYPFFTCAQFPDKIDTYAFDDDVVLVAGNNANGNFHVSRFKGKFNAYQRTYVLTAKKGEDINYIYYSLKLELKRLRERSQGSQTKFLTMPILTNIMINDIKYDDQLAISSVLSQIDKKIEMNNKIINELEAIARLVYDYWFIQFDFPDKSGKPYKSSGGKMVFNEDLKREIPQGWKVIELGDYIDFQKGISYSSKNVGASGTPMINLDSFFLDGSYKNEGLKYFNGKVNNDRLCKKGDLVIAVTDVTRNAEIIGKGFCIPDLFDEDVLISTDVAKVELSDQLTKEYILQLFNSKNYHSYIKHFATGTLVLHLDLNGIRWSKIALPPMELQKKYSEISRSAQIKFANSIKENQSLIKLRDWLLPMLINGQVKVSKLG